MKFIRLEIQNLASLDNEEGEVIEFTKGALGNSTIFSIVGPTGSGKSTILDAICLALYNRAPRYPRNMSKRATDSIKIFGDKNSIEKNKPTPTDCRNILSNGKKDGYSMLTFLANNGCIYRAKWSVHRKDKSIDMPITALVKIQEKSGKKILETADWNDLPQIIGLDYEQFLRTVLIAQGSFANFLTAKEDERYQLLEKLIGCEDMYIRIASAIKQKKTEADDALKMISAQLAAYEKDDLKPEELEALNKRIEALLEEKKNANIQLDAVKKALDWYALEDKHTDDEKRFSEALEKAKCKLDEIKDDAERLSLHDAAQPAIALYGQKTDKEKSMAALQKSIADAAVDIKLREQKIHDAGERQKTLQSTAAKAKTDLDNMKPHINKARTIKGELDGAEKSVKEKNAAMKAAQEAYDKAKKDLDDNTAAIARAEGNKKQKEIALATATAEIGKKTAELQNARDAATEKYDAEARKIEGKDAETLQQAKSIADAVVSDLNEAVRIQRNLKTKHDELQRDTQEVENCEKRNAEIDAQLAKLDTKTLEDELETLKAAKAVAESKDLKRLRSKLVDNEPCPLCGAVHHPYADAAQYAPVVDKLGKLILSKTKLLDETRQQITSLNNEKASNEGKISQQQKNIAKHNDDITRLASEWAVCHAKHPDWPEDADKLVSMQPAAAGTAKKATDALTEHNQLSKTVETLRKSREKAEKACNDYKEEASRIIEKAKNAITDADTQLKTEKGKAPMLQELSVKQKGNHTAATTAWAEACSVVDAKKREMKAEIGDKEPDKYEKELTDAQTKADSEVRKCEDDIKNQRQELEGVKGAMNNASEQKAEAGKEMQQLLYNLAAWLAEYNADSTHERQLTMDEIRSLYLATDNWEKIRSEMKACNDALTSAKTTYNNEVESHRKHLETKPVDDRETLSQRKTELEKQEHNELIESQAQLQRYETARKQMGEMYDQKVSAEQTASEWKSITDAIGTDGKDLRKIAQCYTLRFLIEHANQEIRKFNNRYELTQVRNSLGIRVIDHDRADDIRDTTSLSGGETFIVSLGLALGLSSLSSRNISFENLFIDEGFGTLDPDTLATVIDSLAMLQSSQGKKVGVISHTDTMSERITTQIRIIRNGNSGSSRIEVYP